MIQDKVWKKKKGFLYTMLFIHIVYTHASFSLLYMVQLEIEEKRVVLES